MQFLIKRKSKIHGNGIFTKRDIKKGEMFYKIQIDKISNIPKRRWAFIGKNQWIKDKILDYINHSCNPNSRIDINKLGLIALKVIREGEEITVNYNKTELGGSKARCICKSKNCKGFFLRIE